MNDERPSRPRLAPLARATLPKMSTLAASTKSARHANPPGRLNPYVVGLLGIALATALRLPLEGLLEGRAPYALYFLPILYIAWRADIGPTIATTGFRRSSQAGTAHSTELAIHAMHGRPLRSF
jgi:hypothetical protein